MRQLWVFVPGVVKRKNKPVRGKIDVSISGLNISDIKTLFFLFYLSLGWFEQPILRLSSYNRLIKSLFKTIRDNFLSYSLFLTIK